MGTDRYLVSGAASGIGLQTCARLTAAGGSVIAVDRDRDGLNRLVAAGHCAEAVELDLTQLRRVNQELKGLQVTGIANVAGLGPEHDDPAAILAVNLAAPLRVIETLHAGSSPLRSVVNIASVAGELARRDQWDATSVLPPADEDGVAALAEELQTSADAYTYSKWALLALSMRLAVELAPDVRLNCVSPGFIDTPMGQRSLALPWTAKMVERIPLRRAGVPADIARAVCWLLGDEASFITGISLIVDGGSVAQARGRRRS